MKSSPANWEERELRRVLPDIPTCSLCVFCHEMIGGHDDTTVSSYHRRKRRRRCFPPLSRPSSYVAYTKGGGTSTTKLRESTSKLAENVDESGDESSLASSSSSASSLSLYTSASSEEEPDVDDRLSSRSPASSKCSVSVEEQATGPVGLPPDYLSKYTSFQDWLAKRKSFRNAMGTRADVAGWLQNKKHRTPVEERVLALSKRNASGGDTRTGDVPCSKRRASTVEHTDGVPSRSRSAATAHDGTSSTWTTVAAADLSELDRSSLRQVSADRVTPPREFSVLHHLATVVDEYLRQRRIRLLDLFRCVDVRRSGRCSRQDFDYVLDEAAVPLTQEQAQHLADSLAVDGRPDCIDYSRLAVVMNRDAELRLFRKGCD